MAEVCGYPQTSSWPSKAETELGRPLGSGRRFRRRCHPLGAADGRFLVLSTLDVSNQEAADVVLLVVRYVLGLPAALIAKGPVLFCPHE